MHRPTGCRRCRSTVRVAHPARPARLALRRALIMLSKRDWAPGLGLALSMGTAAQMAVDLFAERRAEPYSRALEAARATR